MNSNLAVLGYMDNPSSKVQSPAEIKHLEDIPGAEQEFVARNVVAIVVRDNSLEYFYIHGARVRDKYGKILSTHLTFDWRIGDERPENMILVERRQRENSSLDTIKEFVVHGTGKYFNFVFRKPIEDEEYPFEPGGYRGYKLSGTGVVDVCALFVSREIGYLDEDIYPLKPDKSRENHIQFPPWHVCGDLTIELYADGTISII